MNKKYMWILLICCGVSLIISIYLFYSLGIYVDEYSTSASIIYWGNIGLYLDWLRLFILIGLTTTLWIKYFQK